MKFTDLFVSREYLFSLGIEEESGRLFLSIPVSNGLVDYEEYYEVNKATFDLLENDVEAAIEFARRCKNREMDDLLMVKPGKLRGTAI
ncbi:hypothetical protein [Pseudomonas sp. PDM13]|uniref:hypothetical protein n=1 Tax=Pseudomonas sp. PDM13 TaxID=2769255 RepID=UPI0021DFE9AA|nr:hypothetical protein [Pseudomonas sp. PDM13]MCU9949184.1 hypothetical protein [Pseudomonas sp. PDM13]